MALTVLPDEVLEQIADHFSVKDLLACSAVCVEWRERFNVDTFWKRFCTKGVKEYLAHFDCEVEPIFVLPEQNEEGLQPLCNWRIHYMRKIHLVNNWKSKKCSSLELGCDGGVILSDVKVDCDGVHWLFIRTISEIEIWNINSVPHLYASVPILLDCSNISVLICGKCVVIAQWNILSVYDLKSCKGCLKTMFRFVLEEEKTLPFTLWNSIDKTKMDFINKVDDFRLLCFGNVLVGHRRIPTFQTDLSMHLWDMTTGEKLKTESMLNCLCKESKIAFANIFKIDELKGLILLVFHSLENGLCSQLYVYDFKKKKFTHMNIMFAGVVVWCSYAQNIIVTFNSHPRDKIMFFNYPSGKLLSVKEVGEYTNPEQMLLVDSYLLYCTFNCMNVLDIDKQEVIHCLQFSIYSFVRKLTVIEPRFVVVWLLERGESPGCPAYRQEVWDVKDLRNKLFQCSSDLGIEMVTNSPSLIKQVINYFDKIYVYTFW